MTHLQRCLRQTIYDIQSRLSVNFTRSETLPQSDGIVLVCTQQTFCRQKAASETSHIPSRLVQRQSSRFVFGRSSVRATDCLDQGLSWLSSVPPGKFRGSTSIGPWSLPYKSFPIHFQPSFHSTLYSLTTDSVVRKPQKKKWRTSFATFHLFVAD
jgi:hypothetical protein